MVSRTANFCIDADNPRAQVSWWAHVLDDFVAAEDNDDDEAELLGPAGRCMIFLRVLEPNRQEPHARLPPPGGSKPR